MSGKWADSDRKGRLPDDWPLLVALVKRRAKNRCEAKLPSGKRCPRKGTDCDHIIPGDDHRLQDLQLLCKFHHGKKSAAEGNAARAKLKTQGLRPEEPHPGTIR